ncbi:type I polyketide synthase [Amycolatopsis sp. YIM 10]|uniref:type I polyketide synthase n=1 Tax=Amycolatopsis sp. YIM 10 TaxID=2653857 RepID=UPI00128FF7D3|nr:type I polyketide synthase [Amycolatopsis sp. YIM 10]QFU88621.1 Phthiocerol/phenolphthiocerol synthesis polyketide synthase type I PpsE [Amycolatopsis sp. YIM 10]
MSEHVAVIGMSARFPGAADLEEFWRLLAGGEEGIRHFTPEELVVEADPAFVPAAGVLDHPAEFDADFFGFTRAEAELTDPQQRLFLEGSWQALEDAGYVPSAFPGRIGVFAGASTTRYRAERIGDGDRFHPMQVAIGNDLDMLALQASYHLDLRGPSMTVQTTCSSSAVAIHLAAQSLLLHESDLALAGGAAVRFLEPRGYTYAEGDISSPDGHCRPFDAEAAGTVAGDGVGVVVLKRLDEAVADGDHVYAALLGSAVNNDGRAKVGITAPSPDGQAAVIAEALAVAGADPATIQYVEAHGTATRLGDPIEVRALSTAFGASAKRCLLGSVKSNIGHADVAAGVAGVIKLALALDRRYLPPTLNYTAPNPEMSLADTPFRVAATGTPWPERDQPSRAGLSSFGIGGTNAHLVFEAAPRTERAAPPRRGWQVLPLSARTPAALDAATDRLLRHLEENQEAELSDVAYTLQVGRTAFRHRRTIVCRDRTGAPAVTGTAKSTEPRVVFLFPGQSSQYPGMGAELYRAEPVFRSTMDECADLLGWDVREAAFTGSAESLRRTEHTQATVFCVDYALARLLMSWGIQPDAMLGHSLGEYVAACLSGVFSLPDALAVVSARSRLMADLPAGRMLAVAAGPEALGGELNLAALNGPESTVISGTAEEIEQAREKLAADGIAVRELRTSHAFHSAMMDPALPGIREAVGAVTRGAPRIPFLSNVTGDWITADQAADPDYWARHTRAPVRFADGVTTALGLSDAVFVEAGPGNALSGLVHGRADAVTLLRRSKNGAVEEARSVTEGLAALWRHGVSVDWTAFGHGRRVSLPTYPFQREHHLLPKPGEAPHPVAEAEPVPEPAWEPGRAWPEDALVREVAEVWHEVIGIDDFGPDDDFFELGGNSLSAIQIVSRLRQRYGQLPMSVIFEAPTVAEVAVAIRAHQAAGVDPATLEALLGEVESGVESSTATSGGSHD